MPWSPKIPIAPGTSWDGRVGASAYWGKYTRKVKMCPHVRPGGGQCGLEAKHCMCMCLLCQAPMSARKRCGAKLPDGSICPWGQDRSPEVSEPEQDPEYHPLPRQIPWHQGLVPSTPPGRVPSDNPPVLYTPPLLCLSHTIRAAVASKRCLLTACHVATTASMQWTKLWHLASSHPMLLVLSAHVRNVPLTQCRCMDTDRRPQETC